MAETIIYNGQTYRRIKGKWVDKDNMVVTHLQRTLDNLYVKQQSMDRMTVDELIAEGDKYKEAGTINLAIRYYEAAMKTDIDAEHKYVLARLTSCYRAQGRANKAIELFELANERFGEKALSSPLCTSVAAAYCDIRDYESAKKYADKAYALNGGKASGELTSVYGRIRKETIGSGAFEES